MKENIFGYGNIVRETNVFFYSNNDELIDKKEKDVYVVSFCKWKLESDILF